MPYTVQMHCAEADERAESIGAIRKSPMRALELRIAGTYPPSIIGEDEEEYIDWYRAAFRADFKGWIADGSDTPEQQKAFEEISDRIDTFLTHRCVLIRPLDFSYKSEDERYAKYMAAIVARLHWLELLLAAGLPDPSNAAEGLRWMANQNVLNHLIHFIETNLSAYTIRHVETV